MIVNKETNVFAGIFDSNDVENEQHANAVEELTGLVLDSAVDNYVLAGMRAEAMSTALDWIDGEDRTPDSLAEAVEVACVDESKAAVFDDAESGLGEAVDDDVYSEMFSFVGDALISLGAKAESVIAFINTDDEDAGYAVGDQLEAVMDELDVSDNELITRFAVGGAVLDDAKKKVVRNGETVFISKKKRKKRQSAAQRAALKKARMKAHKAGARKSRAKSMKKRKSSGLG